MGTVFSSGSGIASTIENGPFWEEQKSAGGGKVLQSRGVW
jgi:hypothetical protein